jgi:methyltransferase (TIGR00027 family)
VDSYVTQDIKKAKLVKIFGELPNHVTFVPVDFTRETLEKRLAESSYDEGAKTLFIMEGVAMYLNPEAMDNIMSFVNGYSGSGSSILFDYFYKSVIDGDEELPLATATRAIIRFREKFQFGIERGQIEGYLTARGFQHIHEVNGEELERMYCIGGNRGRRVVSGLSIVSADVAPTMV